MPPRPKYIIDPDVVIDTKAVLSATLSAIRRIRKLKRISEAAMGKRLGFAQGGYHKMEKGDTYLTFIRFLNICAILEVSPAKLLEDPAATAEQVLRKGPRGYLVGRTYGELTVITQVDEAARASAAKWLCRCSCGNEVMKPGSSLFAYKGINCGCIQKVKKAPPLQQDSLLSEP